ncbi:MAG: hypothetical protein NVS1B13_08570 [Flavisolibacter sp.]
MIDNERRRFKLIDNTLKLIESFVIVDGKERYINLISTKKGRLKLRLYIAHFKDLNGEYNLKLSLEQQNPNTIYKILKSHGASDFCYIISENFFFDEQNLSLLEALNELANSGIGYFLFCIPGKLVYYEGEDINCRFIFYKN